TYSITPYGASAPAYYAVSYVDGTLTIAPARLTVSANNASRTYGAANPNFGTSVTGLVNGDTAGDVIRFAPTTAATAGTDVGRYVISPNATLLSSNYIIGAINPGLLEITPAFLDVSGNAFSMVYASEG